MKKLTVLLVLSLVVFSCKNESKQENKSTQTETPTLNKEKIDPELVGEWFTPRAATLKIQFRSDGTYTFYDSDSLGNEQQR